jgi:AraC-like DNA-binding protein
MQTVDAGLSILLIAFLDGAALDAPAVRARIASWPSHGRVAYSEWLDCLDLLAEEAGCSALGLRIGSCIRAEHLGVVGELARCCLNLGEVLICLQRYHRLIYDGNLQKVSFEGADVVLTWQEHYGSFHPVVSDISLAMFVRMGYLLVGDAWHVNEVCLGDANADDLTPYEDFFACPVSQGRRMPFVRFSMDCLLLPVRDAQLSHRQVVEAKAEARLRELHPVADVFGEQLQQALLKAIYEGGCTLAQVAGHLNISVRSLQRRMAERQQTFAALLDSTRALIAREQVSDRSLPLWRVAMMLGFSEQSAFNRAFKRWYGVSPKKYRLSRS